MRKKQQIVKISRALTQFAIASNTNKRKLGYEKTLENSLGVITVQSLKTLTVRDFKVLCGIIAFIQKNKDSVIKDDKEVVSEIQLKDGDKLFCIDADMYSFVKNYLHTEPSTEEYRLLTESLDVLMHTSITGHYIVEKSPDIKERVIQKTSIVSHVKASAIKVGKRKKYRIRFIFPEWLYNMWKDPKAFVFNNYYIQKTSTRTSTLLCVFLMTQRNSRSYSRRYLSEQLGMDSAVKNRTELRELRKAFDDLLKIGYLRSYHEEKREDDVYFVFRKAN